MKRIIAIIILAAFAITFLGPDVMAAQEASKPITVQNGFVEYIVNKSNGRYSLATTEGLSTTQKDDDKRLLYLNKEPQTSITTIRIDGEDYIFGNNYGTKGGVVSETQQNDRISKTVWKVNGVEVIQTLTLIVDEANPNVGNMRVSYKISNGSNKKVELGARILMDTQLGSNDGAAFVVNGGYITNETELKGEDIPQIWQAYDQRFAPNVITYGLLSGWEGAIAPSKVVMAHWNTLYGTKWDVKTNPLLNFSTNMNSYGSADGGVALFYEPTSLGVSKTRTYETFYGIGSVADASYNSEDYSVQISAPQKLSLNASKTGYISGNHDGYFEVKVDVKNNTMLTLNNFVVTLGLSKELTLYKGQNNMQTIKTIEAGDTASVTYLVEPEILQSTSVAELGVVVTNGEKRAESMKYVILPSAKGLPPSMQMTEIAPSTIYSDALKKNIVIKGNDFNLLKADYDWQVYLCNTDSDDKYAISRADVNISDNGTMTVNLDNSKCDFRAGNYSVSLVSKTYGNLSMPFKISNDEKYNRKQYGVMLIGAFKESEGKPVYDVLMVEKEEDMADLEGYLVRTLGAEKRKEYVDDIKGNILLTVRGEVSSYNANGVTSYTIESGSIINNAIKFVASPLSTSKSITLTRYDVTQKALDKLRDEATGKPLTADQQKLLRQSYEEKFKGWQWWGQISDSLVMSGDGALYVGEYMFHYGQFYTCLEDGADYALRGDPNAKEGGKDIEIVTPANVVSGELFKALGALTGFRITVNNAVFGAKTISLGGSFSVELPWWSKASKGADDDEKSDVYKEKPGMTEKEKQEVKQKNENVDKAKEKFDKLDKTSKIVSSGQKNDSFLELNMEEMRYGVNSQTNSTELVGVKAKGGISLTSDSVPAFTKGGAKASFEVNSIDYDGWFMQIAAGLKVGDAFEANGLFSLVLETGGKIYPDSVELVLGGSALRIPLGPAGFLTKIGGGVYNLYKQLKGNYGKFPPVTVSLISGYADPTLYSFVLDTIKISVGGTGFKFEASDGKIVGLKVLESAYFQLYMYELEHNGKTEPGFDISAGFKANFLGILKGEASAWFSYNPSINGIFGPLSFGGKAYVGVFIPDWIPVLGGIELMAIMAELSTYRAYLGIRIIGIPISVSYYWADGEVKFFDDWDYLEKQFGIPKDELENSIGIYHSSGDTNADSVAVIGSNLKKCYNSEDYLVLMDNEGTYTYDNIDIKEDYGLFSLKLDTLPQNVNDVIKVYDPEDKEYSLEKNENYLVQSISADKSESGLEENYINISVKQKGKWKVVSTKPLEVIGYNVASLPEIEVKDSHLSGDTVKVDWTTKNIQNGYTAGVYVSSGNEVKQNSKSQQELAAMSEEEQNAYYAALLEGFDSGFRIKDGIDAQTGTYSFSLSEMDQRFATGDYRVRTVLYDENGNTVSSAMADKTFRYTNPNMPGEIRNAKLSPAGDGQLKLEYDASEKADGYFVQLLDENAQAIDGFETMDTNKTEVYFNSSMDVPVYKVNNDGSYQTDEKGEPVVDSYKTITVNPDKSYRAMVYAYKKSESGFTTYKGNVFITEPVYLPSPQPAKLSVAVNGISPAKSDTIGNGNMTQAENVFELTTNNNKGNITLLSDQDVSVMYRINGNYGGYDILELKANEPYVLDKVLSEDMIFGEGGTVFDFYAVNKNKDYTMLTVNVNTDTTSPSLMLDNTVVQSTQGSYTITGTAEANARVYVSGKPIAVSNGKFEYNGSGNTSNENIEIKAVDLAGNETNMLCSVIPSEMSRLVDLKLTVNQNELKEDEAFPVAKGDTAQLEVYGITEKGQAILLDSSKAKFSTIYGSDKLRIDDLGEISGLYAGDAVVMCEYAVTDDYSLETTANISVEPTAKKPETIRVSRTDIDSAAKSGDVAARLSIPDMLIGTSVEWSVDDNPYLSVKDNTLILKQDALDMKNFNVAVHAKGNYLVDAADGSGNFDISDKIEFTVKKNVASIALIESLRVRRGTAFSELSKPEKAEVTLSDGTKVNCNIEWLEGGYNSNIAGTYNIAGRLQLPENVSNTDDLSPQIQVKVVNNESGGGAKYFTLQYVAGKGGTISGSSKQSVSVNGNGSPVTAIADEGYSFIGWSDGVKTPVRTDKKVTRNISVTAGFEPKATGEQDISDDIKSIFNDISSNNWFYEAVKYVFDKGYMSGISKSEFAPGTSLTRGMMATILGKLDGADTTGKISGFSDVLKTAYYGSYVAWAAENGIVNGTGGNSFQPERSITREEMAVMFANYIKAKKLSVPAVDKIFAPFADDKAISSWAKDAVYLMKTLGLIKGKDGNCFDAKGTATRAEIASVIKKFDELIK